MRKKLRMPHLPPPDYQLKKIEYMEAIGRDIARIAADLRRIRRLMEGTANVRS